MKTQRKELEPLVDARFSVNEVLESGVVAKLTGDRELCAVENMAAAHSKKPNNDLFKAIGRAAYSHKLEILMKFNKE